MDHRLPGVEERVFLIRENSFITKTNRSLKHINIRLFLALLVLGLCPTIYTTVRTFFLGQLPDAWAYSVAGQLSWVNLIYEIINEAIILPLYFFIGKAADDTAEFNNRVKSGLLVSFALYGFMAVLIVIFAEPLLKLMAASTEILDASAEYIRVESFANIFGILFSFSGVALVALGKEKLVYLLACAKLVLCLLSDAFLVSSLPFSAQLGVLGIGVSNMIVNAFLFAVVLVLLKQQGYHVFGKGDLSFAWMRDFARTGGISGMESFVRNTAYMLMVSRILKPAECIAMASM